MPSIKDLMTKNIITIDLRKSVFDAAVLMSEKLIGCLVIMDKERCVGIVTERDLIERTIHINHEKRTIHINPENTKIKEIMSSDIKTIRPFDKIESAVDMMEKYKIKKLPVISDNDSLVGIVTITDIALAVPALTGRVERFIHSWICPSWTE